MLETKPAPADCDQVRWAVWIVFGRRTFWFKQSSCDSAPPPHTRNNLLPQLSRKVFFSRACAHGKLFFFFFLYAWDTRKKTKKLYWPPSKAANQCVICNVCIDLHMSKRLSSERITVLRLHCVCLCVRVFLSETGRMYVVRLYMFLCIRSSCRWLLNICWQKKESYWRAWVGNKIFFSFLNEQYVCALWVMK